MRPRAVTLVQDGFPRTDMRGVRLPPCPPALDGREGFSCDDCGQRHGSELLGRCTICAAAICVFCAPEPRRAEGAAGVICRACARASEP